MKCKLCSKDIAKYDIRFNHIDAISIDICTSCVDKIVDWHGKNISTLFPTKQMKKRYG